MERTEELLLNFALNWAAGEFRPRARRSSDGRRTPYAVRESRAAAASPPSYAFVTDGYFAFASWLRDAWVVVVRPDLPEEFPLLQQRLAERRVTVQPMDQDAETGVLCWPRGLPDQLVGVFSEPDVVRSLRGHFTVMALLPTHPAALQEVRSWRVNSMKRLDLLWAQQARFRDFLRRNLTRTGASVTLTPAHFQFLSRWMLVEVDVQQQSPERWYWPLPVFPCRRAARDPPAVSEEPPPPPPLAWVMPGEPTTDWTSPQYASLVIASAIGPPGDPTNSPPETRGQTAGPPNSPPPRPPTDPPPHEYRPTTPTEAPPFFFSE